MVGRDSSIFGVGAQNVIHVTQPAALCVDEGSAGVGAKYSSTLLTRASPRFQFQGLAASGQGAPNRRCCHHPRIRIPLGEVG